MEPLPPADTETFQQNVDVLKVLVQKTMGHVKWYSVRKGYGFICSDNDGDVFVHRSAISSSKSYPSLKNGEHVEFSVVETDRGVKASSVTAVGGQPVEGVASLFRRLQVSQNTVPYGERNGDTRRRGIYRGRGGRRIQSGNQPSADSSRLPFDAVGHGAAREEVTGDRSTQPTDVPHDDSLHKRRRPRRPRRFTQPAATEGEGDDESAVNGRELSAQRGRSGGFQRSRHKNYPRRQGNHPTDQAQTSCEDGSRPQDVSDNTNGADGDGNMENTDDGGYSFTRSGRPARFQGHRYYRGGYRGGRRGRMNGTTEPGKETTVQNSSVDPSIVGESSELLA